MPKSNRKSKGKDEEKRDFFHLIFGLRACLAAT